MSERKLYKPKPVSGFPEWLPEVRLIEQQWFDHIRRVFESYGFCSVETPSVEELEVIAAKGEVDKEIYVIERLHKEEGDKEARLALHFDQTVPLARYVAQHFNELVFPFKRYQMQRVWRGERPQAGRFREFYQCDIDVINIDSLPLHFDAEMPAIIWEVLSGLPGMENEKIQLRVSNRKILFGLLKRLDVPNQEQILSIIDKIHKISAEKTLERLKKEAGLSTKQANTILEFASIRTTDLDAFHIFLEEFIENNTDQNYEIPAATFVGSPEYLEKERFLTGIDTLSEGAGELNEVIQNLSHLPKDAIMIDLSIVRGLDYYTGTVYETVFVDDPGYGSICSGGRYDDLASSYINKKLPGVGISIGFSRLFARMVEKKTISTARKSPADVLMILPSEEQRAMASATAQKLRARGVKVELFHAPKKIPDQLKYASRKGIPYVWFPDTGEVKNMITGEQKPADPKTWTPEEKR